MGRVNPSLRHVDTSGGHRPRSAKVVVSELVLLLEDELLLSLLKLCMSFRVCGDVGAPSDSDDEGKVSSLLSADEAGRLRLEPPLRNRLDMLNLLWSTANLVGMLPPLLLNKIITLLLFFVRFVVIGGGSSVRRITIHVQ